MAQSERIGIMRFLYWVCVIMAIVVLLVGLATIVQVIKPVVERRRDSDPYSSNSM